LSAGTGGQERRGEERKVVWRKIVFKICSKFDSIRASSAKLITGSTDDQRFRYIHYISATEIGLLPKR
jgi:hypothetical protein